MLDNDCKIRGIVWDNEGVLTDPDWNVCYDIAYRSLGIAAPLAGDPSRGKRYKQVLAAFGIIISE
jgi:hypothetical protein